MEEHEGMQDIEALVPEAEIVDYVTQLKSITSKLPAILLENSSLTKKFLILKRKLLGKIESINNCGFIEADNRGKKFPSFIFFLFIRE